MRASIFAKLVMAPRRKSRLDRHQSHVGLGLAAGGRLAGRIFPQGLLIRKSRRIRGLDGDVVNNLTPQGFLRLLATILEP